MAAITACSNVTGIRTPYHEIAKLIHEAGGRCFVDFACSAPYVPIDMHPLERGKHLDAVYFSPHKFLGGPGTPGVLIFDKKMCANRAPDRPGGGTVVYTNPWKAHEYIKDLEQREDGGTPPFLQGIKAAMCVRLKEKMGTGNMLLREGQILGIVFSRFGKMKNVHVLEAHVTDRSGVISFMIEGAHHNWICKALSDRFGIQIRGGCSCAGTYGHRLLGVTRAKSKQILEAIRSGDLAAKPGWARLSVHPTMTDAEVSFVMDAIEETAANWEDWIKQYSYDPLSNEWSLRGFSGNEQRQAEDWFDAFS